MAGKQVLYIIEAPLTIDHAIVSLESLISGGFSRSYHMDRAIFEPTREDCPNPLDDERKEWVKAMDRRVQAHLDECRRNMEANEAVVKAVFEWHREKGGTNDPTSAIRMARRSGSYAMAVLAPQIDLGDRRLFDEENSLWDHTQQTLVIDWRIIADLEMAVIIARDNVSDFFKSAEDHAHHAKDLPTPEALRTFLEDHLGKIMVIHTT